jgi:transcription antitermination factor NusG
MFEQAPWFAVRVRPRYERQVADSIQSKGFSCFLPVYSARRRWSDRVKELELPLFDGYVFCQTDIDRRLPILTTPGVIQFVGVGKTPIPVEDHEMEAIRTVAQSGSLAKPWPFLRQGDRVRVDEGPLRSLEGILLSSERDDHLVVSVTLLQRSVAVRVEREWLTPVRSWLRN